MRSAVAQPAPADLVDDQARQDAARAQPLQRLQPLAEGGRRRPCLLYTSSLIVFGLSASSFAIPALLGGRRLKMVATVVYDEFLTELNWPLGAAIAIVPLVVNVVIMMAYNLSLIHI